MVTERVEELGAGLRLQSISEMKRELKTKKIACERFIMYDV